MQGTEGGSVSLWEDSGNEGVMRELRKPNLPNTTTTPPSAPVVKKESTLSVDAKEFVPMKIRHNSVQDRLNIHRIGNNAPQMQQLIMTSDNDDFKQMQDLIRDATFDPGLFEHIVEPFLETIGLYVQDEAMISIVAEFLFTHAVDQPSFRYNGARLSAVVQGQIPSFTDHMVQLSRQYEGQPRPGLLLFLAELQVQHNNVFAGALYDTINKMLALGGDDNVKTVCQALKLSGCSLDSYSKEQMDNVIAKLKASKNSVMNNIINLIESVISLRLNNWGQNSTTPSSSSQENGYIYNHIPSMEAPIFYGPDGKEMSSDEQRFLAAECGDKCIYDDVEDPDDLYDPEPEMDEEIRAGFREFMKMTRNNQRN